MSLAILIQGKIFLPIFPSPARVSLPMSLVSDIPAWDGKSFFTVYADYFVTFSTWQGRRQLLRLADPSPAPPPWTKGRITE
jgi:hypothetical protein